MKSKVYKGDIGTDIILDCVTDISSATTREILVKKPDGSTVTWAATAEGATSIKYTVQSGDLSAAGLYLLQASIVTPSWSGRGETFELRVYDHFK